MKKVPLAALAIILLATCLTSCLSGKKAVTGCPKGTPMVGYGPGGWKR